MWSVVHDDSGWVVIQLPLVLHPLRDVPTGDVTSHQDEGVTAGVVYQHHDAKSVEKRAGDVESILLARYCRSWDVRFIFPRGPADLEDCRQGMQSLTKFSTCASIPGHQNPERIADLVRTIPRCPW